MITPACTTIDERLPFAVKRRMRRKSDHAKEPAITVLPPEPRTTLNASDFFQSSSPGVYKAAPSKAASDKGLSSFVILGEMLNTPVQSRPPSPSGRVSPFRGHGFKTPATSRAPSPSQGAQNKKNRNPMKTSLPKKSPVPAKGPKYGTDIGLPPKSPKRFKARQLNSKISTIQRTNLGIEVKLKPAKPPNRKQPTVVNDRKNLNPKSAENASSPVKMEPAKRSEEKENTENGLPKDTDLKEVSEALRNLIDEKAEEMKNEASIIIKELANESDPPKMKHSGEEKDNSEGAGGQQVRIVEIELESGEKEPREFANRANEDAAVYSAQKTDTSKSAGNEMEKNGKKLSDRKESEKLIPCLQPDKCHIAPPTMASPSPIITSAVNAPSITPGTALTKTTESIATTQSTVTTSLNALSSAVTISGNLSKKSQTRRDSLAAAKEAASRGNSKALEEGNGRATAASDASHTGDKETGVAPDSPELSALMMPREKPLRPETKKETNNLIQDEVISTSHLIKVGSDLELLSANNLRNSPPRREPNPAWNEERLVNGDVPSNAPNRSRFRRFLLSVWNLIKYLICCRCILDLCKRLVSCKRWKCCRKSEGITSEKSCLSKLACSSCCKGSHFFGCCGRSSCCSCCSCAKIKCCDNKNCCSLKRKAHQQNKKCCAKRCGCRDCCAKMNNCCLNCGDKINNFFRALFCLNMLCCQRCLRRCCKSCHKMKCCQSGGICRCFNPNVKKDATKREVHRLDKRASTQSKKEKENLDPVLVEHVSLMKAAIPVLPISLAVLCLIINLIFPGMGTVLSGAFCLCFGKPRFSIKDSAKNRIGSFCVNFVIGIAQLFTIIFCLVGWGWSIWWGVILYRLARKQRRIKLAEESTQKANEAANQNHVDIEKG